MVIECRMNDGDLSVGPFASYHDVVELRLLALRMKLFLHHFSLPSFLCDANQLRHDGCRVFLWLVILMPLYSYVFVKTDN